MGDTPREEFDDRVEEGIYWAFGRFARASLPIACKRHGRGSGLWTRIGGVAVRRVTLLHDERDRIGRLATWNSVNK